MQVILSEDIPTLGRTGQEVTVKDGYGRNYLLPRGLALLATPRNVKLLDHNKRIIEQRNAKRHKDAVSIKEKLEAMSITLARHKGEGDKLFGSVTNRDIADAIAEEGVTIDRKQIVLEQPIKSIGVYTVLIQLAQSLTANLKVWVVAK